MINSNSMVDIASWWQSVPFGTKLTLFISVSFWFLQFIFGWGLCEFFINEPNKVIISFQIWRLFFTPFIQGGFFGLILNCLAVFDASKVEKRIGTILFFYEIILKSVIAEVLYILLFAMFYLVGITLSPSYGLWNVIFYFITFRALQHPEEEQQIFCFPFVVKAQFYFVLLIVALNIFNFPKLDLLGFVILAFLECKVLKGSLFRLSKGIIERIERSRFCNHYQSRQDFIIVDHADDLIFQGTQKIQFNFFSQGTRDLPQIVVEDQLPVSDKQKSSPNTNDSLDKQIDPSPKNIEEVKIKNKKNYDNLDDG